MIKVKGLKKNFGKLEVLKGIDLDINPGKTTAILGPNGSGKTTLMKSILGMVRPSSGTITYRGIPVLEKWMYRQDIGYLPQIAKFPENLTVMELISLVENLRNVKGDWQKFIDLFDLQPNLRKKVGYLSGGTRQKVNLLLTFMFDCPVYILDEPTSGLDPVAMIRLKDLIYRKKDEGKTILISTHIMNIVGELADELVFLLEGNIFYKGSYEGLLIMQQESDLERAIAKILSENHVENLEVQPI